MLDLLKIDVEGAEYDQILATEPSVFDGVDRVVSSDDSSMPGDPSVTGRTSGPVARARLCSR
jgi:hypothetical protein